MNDLVAAARIAARSAHVLFDLEDYRGAVSRAYYAMFDLARHALRDIDPELAIARKHGTIIARFSKHLILEKGYSRELGRALRVAFDARLIADYSDAGASRDQAEAVLVAMDRFMEAVAGKED